jgi:hypothetical protein
VAGPREISAAAQPNVVGGGRVISSPFQFFVDGADNLLVEGWNTVASARLEIVYRFVEPTGTVRVERHELTLTADRVGAERIIGLQPGALLNMSVVAIGAAPRIGQTFVCVKLVRGTGAAAIVVGLLLQGYVTAEQGLGWPGSPIVDSITGGGVIRTISGTNPAAGAEISEAVPTGARWQLLYLRTNLVASAAVAVRAPNLRLNTTSGANKCFIPAPQTITAGQDVGITWGSGSAQFSDTGNRQSLASLPNDVILLAGETINTVTFNLDVGDDWAGPQLVVREWLEIDA